MSYLTVTGEQIKTALSIAGVLYTDGDDSIKVICPYHNDQNPSLSIKINPSSEIFGLCKCFSCGKTTNVQTLIKDLTGQSIYQLLNMDTNYNNFQFINYLPNKKQKTIEDKSVFSIDGEFLKIKEGTEAYNYLVHNRKVGSHLIDKFEMSYTKYSEINKEYVILQGKEVLKRSVFMHRICTPIYYNNKLVNIDGRDYTGNQQPKVLYPRKSLKPLFNIDNLDFGKPLYLAEGLIDCLNVYEYINCNCTCSLGSELNDLQITLLNKFKTIILLMDNDEAGYRMAINIDNIFDGDVYIAEINNDYKDVNDIVKDNNISYLKNIVDNRKHITEIILNKYELF